MPSLPPLDMAGSLLRLPLSADVAAGWIDALLVDSFAERESGLKRLIARDAPLALWTILSAAKSDEVELRTPHALATWLAARPPHTLATTEETRSRTPTKPQLMRTMQRASAALRVAERSAEVARAAKLDDGEARLAGLLHEADAWLAAAGIRDRNARRSVLPAWLRDLIAALEGRRRGDRHPLADVVRRAIRAPARAAKRTSLGNDDWKLATPAEANRLRAVADRVARLAGLETQFAERLEAEKLGAMAELAAGAGHEMNPPLAIISGRVQLFLSDEQDAERRRELALVNRQALRVHEMIADMMHFARPAQPRPERCDLATLVEEVLTGLGDWAAERKIALDANVAQRPLLAQIDRVQMHVALRAVVTNSIEAIGSDGRVTVACRQRAEEPTIEIAVRDTGPGLTEEVRRHLFDPFYSGRGAGRGLGLGLSKCWRIVTNHGGRIEVESELGGGTTITLLIPVAATVARAPTETSP